MQQSNCCLTKVDRVAVFACFAKSSPRQRGDEPCSSPQTQASPCTGPTRMPEAPAQANAAVESAAAQGLLHRGLLHFPRSAASGLQRQARPVVTARQPPPEPTCPRPERSWPEGRGYSLFNVK